MLVLPMLESERSSIPVRGSAFYAPPITEQAILSNRLPLTPTGNGAPFCLFVSLFFFLLLLLNSSKFFKFRQCQ